MSPHRPRRALGTPRLAAAALMCLAASAGAAPAGAAPGGNNGSVKIAQLDDGDRAPDNTPHVGCSFAVEWYGYDAGADVVSTVTFAEQDPTQGVGLVVAGPSQVFVGEDRATGAGTSTGLDGRETYTLSFTGDPHPQQGFHVRVTVATPRSHGSDTKTKVFWVQDCEETPPNQT
ncbi:hypothetical protein [Nocardioides sp.]|uniref:hypothetical protein n=1 Tax=Nocardioides sp. TaxID=35761 RepID=UPI0035B41F8A